MATLRRVDLGDYEMEVMTAADDGELALRTVCVEAKSVLRYLLSVPNGALTGADMPTLLGILGQLATEGGADDSRNAELLLDKPEYEVLTRAIKKIQGIAVPWALLIQRILEAPEVEVTACR
jgi:hypothetical protein